MKLTIGLSNIICYQRMFAWFVDDENRTVIYIAKNAMQTIMVGAAKESMAIKILSCTFSAFVRWVSDRLICTELPIKPIRTIVKRKAKTTANNANVAATRLFRTNTKRRKRYDWNKHLRS